MDARKIPPYLAGFFEPVGEAKAKDCLGIPWLLAFALRDDGWWLRSDIIWQKPNPMPESVRDRPTRAHEYLFLLSKSARYYYNAKAIAEPGATMNDYDATRQGHVAPGQSPQTRTHRTDKQRGHGRRHAGFNARWDAMGRSVQCGRMRNKRDVWMIAPKPFPGAHFAVMPEALVEPCILAGAPEGGIVLDPFAGAGTVLAVAKRLGRASIGFDLNPEYVTMANRRIIAEQEYLGKVQDVHPGTSSVCPQLTKKSDPNQEFSTKEDYMTEENNDSPECETVGEGPTSETAQEAALSPADFCSYFLQQLEGGTTLVPVTMNGKTAYTVFQFGEQRFKISVTLAKRVRRLKDVAASEVEA